MNKLTQPPEFMLAFSNKWTDYALLDSGDGFKLERFGHYTFLRPEPQALWAPMLTREEWETADASFLGTDSEEGGNWQFAHKLEPRWKMRYQDIQFWAKATSFRHLGVFPEQASQWEWLDQRIRQADRPTKVLNLFGYTGLASLVAANAGATVTHVDASKQTLTWAHENQELSGLADRPIRWIVEDALKFVQREIRRGAHYDGIILDPPKFGRGSRGEVWKLQDSLQLLLEACRDLLSDQPLFLLITCYAIRMSALSLYYTLGDLLGNLDGELSCGELVNVEQSAGRMLSTAIFARWSAK